MQQRRADAALAELAHQEVDRLSDVYELMAMAADTTPRIVALNTTQDPLLGRAFGPQIGPKVDRINAQRDKIRAGVSTDEERAWLQEFDASGKRILASLAAMREALQAGDEVAQGNLAMRGEAAGHDEFAQLNRTLKTMADALREVVQGVRSGTDQIATASQEIANGSLDLSQRTERAAGHLQQTASTMDELTAVVRQTADSAHQAKDLSRRASEIAERGGAAVGQVVSTVGAPASRA